MLRISAKASNSRVTSSGQEENYGARRCLSPKKRISTARLCPVQGIRIIRETEQLLLAPLIFRSGCLRSRALHSQNWPDSLGKPR